MNKKDKYLFGMGSNIKVFRKKRHLTQRELGSLCKIEESTISRIEGGKMNVSILTLKKIADVLDVSLDAFFSDS